MRDFDVVGNGSVKQDKTADAFWMGSNLSNLSVAEYETIKTKYKVIAKAGSTLPILSLATIQQALAQASSQKLGNTMIIRSISNQISIQLRKVTS